MFYVSRCAGFTPLQSHRLASSSSAIDYSELTEPVQTSSQLKFLKEAYLQQIQNPRIQEDLTQTEPGPELREVLHRARVRFHAMMDMKKFPRCHINEIQKNQAKRAIEEQREALLTLAVQELNPGPLMHFLLDEYSHRGYYSLGGHWMPISVTEQHEHPFGAYCDFISAAPVTDRVAMCDHAIQYLRKFMEATCKAQSDAINTARDGDLQGLISELSRINPPPMKDTLLNFGEKNIEANYYSKIVGMEGPDLRSADDTVQRFLSQWQELEPLPRERVQYKFDADGRIKPGSYNRRVEMSGDVGTPVNFDDHYVLYSDLSVEVKQATEPILLNVGLRPSRKGEKDILLVKGKPVADTTKPIHIGHFPVGKAFVEILDQNNEILRKRDFLASKRVETVTLELPLNPRLQIEVVEGSISPPIGCPGDTFELVLRYRVRNVKGAAQLQTSHKLRDIDDATTIGEGTAMHTQSGEVVEIRRKFKPTKLTTHKVRYTIEPTDSKAGGRKLGTIAFVLQNAPNAPDWKGGLPTGDVSDIDKTADEIIKSRAPNAPPGTSDIDSIEDASETFIRARKPTAPQIVPAPPTQPQAPPYQPPAHSVASQPQHRTGLVGSEWRIVINMKDGTFAYYGTVLVDQPNNFQIRVIGNKEGDEPEVFIGRHIGNTINVAGRLTGRKWAHMIQGASDAIGRAQSINLGGARRSLSPPPQSGSRPRDMVANVVLTGNAGQGSFSAGGNDHYALRAERIK